MADEKRARRLNDLKAEFRVLIAFHAKSFEEIDAKAKYWMTLTLPSFIALAGYLFNRGSSMALTAFVAAWALATCLFVSTILFSRVMLSRFVESGILVPRSRNIDDAAWYLENEERWSELCKDQAAEILRAIKNNEYQNALKASRMRKAEVSLFRGAPSAICLAGGSTLLYAATCPHGFVAATAGIGAGGPAAGVSAFVGVVLGAATAATFILVDHFLSNAKELDASAV